MGELALEMAAAFPIDKYSSDQEFSEWYSDFLATVDLQGTPDDKVKSLLQLFLKGPEKEILKSLSDAETATPAIIGRSMASKLKNEHSTEEAQDCLENMKKNAGLSISDFAVKVKKLVGQAYPSLPMSEKNKMNRKYFIRGLPTELQKRINIMEPQGFDDTIRYARNQERFLKEEPFDRSESNFKRDMTHLNKEIQMLKDQLNLERTKKKTVCEYCGIFGHESVDCRRRIQGRPPPTKEELEGRKTNYPKNTQISNVNQGKREINRISAMYGTFLLGGARAKLLIDTGAARTAVKEAWYHKNKSQLPIPRNQSGMTLSAANGLPIAINHVMEDLSIEVNGVMEFLEVPVCSQLTSGVDGIIGIDALSKLAANINLLTNEILINGMPVETVVTKLQDFESSGKTENFRSENSVEFQELINIEKTPVNEEYLDDELIYDIEDEIAEEEDNEIYEELAMKPVTRTNRRKEEVLPLFVKNRTIIPPRTHSRVEMETFENELGLCKIVPEDFEPEGNGGFLQKVIPIEEENISLSYLNIGEEPRILEAGQIIARAIPTPLEDIEYEMSAIAEEDGPDIKNNVHPDYTFKLEHLEESQRKKMMDLINAYPDVFAKGPLDIGETDVMKFQINTGDSQPIRQNPRRKSPEARKVEAEILQQMRDAGVVRPSNSDWCSPVLLVKKKDGSFRYCIDFRKLNQISKSDSYPLPNINECLEALGGNKFFASADLISGYWQMKVREEDIPKTAFTSGRRLWEFTRLPFGVTGGVPGFSRLMEKVLDGLQYEILVLFLDDILIFAKTFEELLERIEIVLQRLETAGLKLKPNKCSFGVKQVTFLGHIVSEDGISTDPKKIEAMTKLATPTNRKQLRSMLGLFSYYRKFVQNFSKIASPLYKLTSEKNQFVWNQECDIAVEELKEKLTTTPVLIFPDYEKQFVIYTDASSDGLGAVLSQEKDGVEHPVVYASRTLGATEKSYSSPKLECLALTWAVQFFHNYIHGKEFVIVTDHNNLTWLSNNRNTSSMLGRWSVILGGYNFKVVFKKGKLMGHVDALSRLPSTQEPNDDYKNVDLEYVAANFEDETERIKLWINGESRLPSFLSILKHHKVEERGGRVLVDEKVYVPTYKLPEVLQTIHSHPCAAGHFGMEKTLEKFRENFFGIGTVTITREICQTCVTCQRTKKLNYTPKSEMKTVKASEPWEIISLDFCSGLPETKNYNRYILIVTDVFSKFLIAIPTKDMKAETVADLLIERVVAYHGVPLSILTDQGTMFESQLFGHFCETLQIKKMRTSTYRPQGNGLNERTNRTMQQILKTLKLTNSESEWDSLLPLVMIIHNANKSSSTEYSPHEVIFGRFPRMPLDMLCGTLPVEDHTQHEYVMKMKRNLQEIGKQALNNQERATMLQKKNHDAKTRVNHYEVGEFLFVASTTNVDKKLAPIWNGPYEVLQTDNHPIIWIRTDKGIGKVHHDRTKKCKLMNGKVAAEEVRNPNTQNYLNKKINVPGQPYIPPWRRREPEQQPEEEEEEEERPRTPTRYSLRQRPKKNPKYRHR